MDKAYSLTQKAFKSVASIPPVDLLKVFFSLFLFSSMAVLGLEIGAVTLDKTLPLSISSIPFSGIAPSALEKELSALQDKIHNEKISLRVDGVQDAAFETTRKECGLTVDVVSLRAQILSLGKTGNPLKDFPVWVASFSGTLSLSAPYALDEKKLEATVANIKKTIDRDAKDARVDFSAKAILPDAKGIKLDAKKSMELLKTRLPEFAGAIFLHAEVKKPRVAAEDIKDLVIANIVAFFETPYNAGVSNRVSNLKLAAQKLDGIIMKPGDVISYNEIVGDRNEENGFKLAPQIVRGELVPGIGGGACQISSTLHAAAFYAGMSAPTRSNHSLPSHYIGMGLDATVFYPFLDLKLKNTLPFTVVIHTIVGANGSKVRMEIRGKEKLYDVSLKRSIIGVYPPRVETRRDASLPAGKVVREKKGSTGYKVSRVRVFKQGDKTWEEKLPDDFYPPQKEVRRVGTAVAKKPAPAAATTVSTGQ